MKTSAFCLVFAKGFYADSLLYVSYHGSSVSYLWSSVSYLGYDSQDLWWYDTRDYDRPRSNESSAQMSKDMATVLLLI